MRPVEEIIALYRQRMLDHGPLIEQCRIVSEHYNNQVTLPLPELDKTEAPAVANLLKQGVDQHAMRVASVLPDVQAPALKPGDKASEKRADQRRRASLGFLEVNGYDLLMKQRARWLGAFAQAPVRLYPDRKMRGPAFNVRSPLQTYPAAMDVGQMQPDDCIFASSRTVGWVRKNYPDVPLNSITISNKYSSDQRLQDTDQVEVVEYLDGEETVVIIYGPGECNDLTHGAEWSTDGRYRIVSLTPPGIETSKQWGTEILRVPNRLGETPVVIPGRISLDALRGQFDDMPGLANMQAKLAAMELNAIANGIWPDQWMVGVDGRNPQMITAADGRRGIVGEIRDGNIITTQMQPGVQTPMAMDRLERAQRLNGGIPADFSGESASNVRTARRGDAVLSAAVDYTIQEHQQILASSVQKELGIAANIDLTYFRNEKKSFYVSWKHGKGRLDYTPGLIWAEDRTLRVSYAKAGADVNMLNVQIGQLVSLGLLSKDSAARMHPDIKDPDYEHARTIAERLTDVQLAALEQQAQAGGIPPDDLARIAVLVVENGGDLAAAVTQAHKEAQERQASTVTPAEPGSPEAQAGLAQPGQGAEAGVAVNPPAPSVANLTDILRTLGSQRQAANA